MAWSAATQDVVVSTSSTIGAVLSILGAIYIIATYRRRQQPRSNATTELIHVLAWFDLFISFGHAASTLPAKAYNAKAGESVALVCKMQAYDIMFHDLTLVAWNCCIAHNLSRWVCHGDDQAVLRGRLRVYLAVTLGFAFTIATAGFIANVYGDAELWCWVSIPGDANRSREIAWKFGGLFGWLFLAMLYLVVSLVRVRQNVNQRVQGVLSEQAKTAYRRVVRSQELVLIGFFVCWLPCALHRTIAVMMNMPEVYPLNVLQGVTNSLQGIVHAIIFGHFHEWIAIRLHGGREDRVLLSQGGVAAEFAVLAEVEAREKKHFAAAKVAVFLSTVDLKWGEFAEDLDAWIPAGNDIYVVTLLNCAGVRRAEQRLANHLININAPLSFRSLSLRAPSSRRDHAQICQFVFVISADVVNETLRYEANDQDLWMLGKPMQQAVGATLRYFDTTIALVSCNTGKEPEVDDDTGSPTMLSLRHAHSVGIDLRHCQHTFQLGCLHGNVGIALYSLPFLQEDVRSQHKWSEVLDVDGEPAAVCSLVELEVDRQSTMSASKGGNAIL